MKRRFITAGIIILVLTAVRFLSKFLVYPLVISSLCLTAVYELLKVLGMHKSFIVSIPSYLIAFALPTVCYFVEPQYQYSYLLISAYVLMVFLLYLFGACVFTKGRITFSSISSVFALEVYAIASFTSMSMIRYIPYGLFCLGIILISAWICDSFAYIVGSLIGKHKLIPEISPKKTVEGSIGGIVFATAALNIYGVILELVTDITVSYITLTVLGVILSVVSQVGDLVASVIKREHGIKDFGNVMPGHGGIMDRFDSILPVSIVLLVFCMYFSPFT
jgi:phosphatidate cytidylyltransferase